MSLTRIQHVIIHSKSTTNEQIFSLVRQHVEALEPFLGDAHQADNEMSNVSDWLDQLSSLCRVQPETAPIELYEQVVSYLRMLKDFLRLVNQDLDTRFESTPIGAVWSRAELWCKVAQGEDSRFTRDQIWDWIAPAEPDSVEDLGNNIFEAKWAAPIPAMDVEIFRRTKGIQICGEPTEPTNMPNGVAFRFCVI